VGIWERLDRLTAPRKDGPSAAHHGARLGVAVVLALFTYALFPATPAVDFPLLEVGSVAPDDIISPFAFNVPKDPRELERERDDVSRAILPIFNFVPANADSAQRQLTAFMRNVDQASSSEDGARETAAIQGVARASGLQLDQAEAIYLSSASRRGAFEQAISRAYNRTLRAGVAPTTALDTIRGDVVLVTGDTRRTVRSDSLVSFGLFVSRARQQHPAPGTPVADTLYTKLVTAFFRPTIVLDRAATEAQREELRDAIPVNRFEVRAQEKIVGSNEVVGQTHHDKMRALRDEMQRLSRGERSIGRIIGAVLFNALVIAIFGITLVMFRPHLYASFRSLVTIGFVFALVIAGAAVVSRTGNLHPELIPVAIAAIVISILFDPRISMIAAMVLAVLVGGQSAFRGTNALFINLIGGVAAAFSVRIIRRRDQGYYSMLMIAGAYALAAFAVGLTLDRPIMEILASSAWGGVNAIVSVAFAMQVLLPLAEEFTGIDTYPRLLEWSDLNRPLMRQLSLEAPGTYAHTMSIANLSEAACNAIGANGLLARVGAYYHDIGKLKKPQYFAENQPRGRNPHDMLKPATSAAIIRNHVQEGVELAEKHKLPKSVRRFITEHHGTGAIVYFLEKSRERDGPVAHPEEYAYPGPLPQTAETAVVMLADGVEAATRVLADPTPQKIRDVVDHIVRQRIEQGQLKHTPLTLAQIDTIKDQFVRVLVGMNHNRIDYPASGGGITAEFAAR
jgi:cyclic-di-AMP phosphodiesterase PgpH